MNADINLGSYHIYYGDQTFQKLSEFLQSDRYKNAKIFILTDEIISEKWLEFLLENVPELENSEMIQIDSGEDSKAIEICMEVWKILLEEGADKKSLLINFGGGVISDLGGFVASTFKRGIDFINIPTTLLSQVDASIGGKLGIDFLSFKNQIGLFKNPIHIFSYPGFLSTLDQKQIVSGFAEMIKHGLIADTNLWEEIKKINSRDLKSIQNLVLPSLKIKCDIVNADPFEKNIRKTLNFGHTIGHAIESYSLANDEIYLMHGEAIAIGMICESYLSNKIAGLSDQELSQIVNFIKSNFNPYLIDKITADELIAFMHQDKKNENAKINFTLLPQIGKAAIDFHADEILIKEAIWFYSSEIGGKISQN